MDHFYLITSLSIGNAQLEIRNGIDVSNTKLYTQNFVIPKETVTKHENQTLLQRIKSCELHQFATNVSLNQKPGTIMGKIFVELFTFKSIFVHHK